MVTALIVLAALGFLGWGFYRARPYGQVGVLAWLQSAVLMAPWLVFFGLFAAGIYLNLAGILFLAMISIGLYIFIGSRLRAVAQATIAEQATAKQAEKSVSAEGELAPLGAETDDRTPRSPAPSVGDNSPKPVEKAVEPKPDVVPIPAEDLRLIQGIFGIDTFFATETIPYQNGVIIRGNLRGDATQVHDRLSARLKEQLEDRYRLFLVENPDGKPVMIVLPSSDDPKVTTPWQLLVAIVLCIATLATCLETAGLLLGFDFFSAPHRLKETLPLGISILGVLVAHELGHRWQAAWYHIRLSPPFFIPTWQIGSFGALTRFESLLPNRSVLFDIAVAGPLAGGLVSLLFLVTGLLLSRPDSLFQLPSQFFQGSILVGALARVVLGEALQTTIVHVHPLVLIGWLGLVITALNLMPAGQLDGGRIVQAIYGRKTAGRLTIATIVVLGIVAFVNPLGLYWALVILVLQRNLERPSLNELSEPNDARAALALLALFLMIVTLLPLSPGLAGRLGIGEAMSML
jgi:hypothetical protein